MAIGDAVKFGILRTRDLVELYYGARMVVTIKESYFSAVTSLKQVLGPDSRRIRYEIVIGNASNAAPFTCFVGSPASMDSLTAAFYHGAIASTLVIDRSFLTDMEAVCLPISVRPNLGSLDIGVRETFLTPAPVDEFP